MADIIVVSFNEETEAREALRKIEELNTSKQITLYEHITIRKKENNEYEVLGKKDWKSLTVSGFSDFIDTITGPVKLTAGLLTGTAVASIVDYKHYDFDDDFLKKISNKIKTETFTIIAEVNEDSYVFIDNILKPFNTEILRTEADIEYSDYIEDQIEDLEDKIDKYRKKFKNAIGEEKEKIEDKIADLKVKRKVKISKLEKKEKSTLQEIKDRTKAQIDRLEDRLEDFGDAILDAFNKAKAKRLKRRISKQKAKLIELTEKLDDVLD